MLRSIILMLAMAVFAFQVTVNAQGRGPRDDRPEWGKKYMEKLDLTDAQQEKIEKLRIDHQKQMVDLKASLEKEQIAMKELLGKDDLSRSAYVAQQDKLAAARDKIQKAVANHQMDIYEQLNADQKKTWRENHRRRSNDSKGNFRKGGRGPGKRGPGFGPCCID
ncbi:MAG: periplasmic heavy metal sensor [Ignavibacteriaceae bacterium]|nr:periplasmic heavy metal sensor [Ignavibacteriaceae bacterium]